MDRLEAMSILLAVAEKGSFTAAAKALGVPLSTVSRKVSELEVHLGTQLLARSTRNLALTDAGATYLASARRIIAEVDDAERVAAGEFSAPRGELVVTAPVLFGQLYVVPVIAEFLALHPLINVRLLLSDRNLHLIEDHVDLAVRIGHLPDSGLRAARIGTMRVVTCAAPALLAAHGHPCHPEALSRLPTINFEPLGTNDSWRFRDPNSAAPFDVPITPRFATTCAAAVADAAVRGIGMGRLLHYQAAPAIAAGQLAIILPGFEPEPLPVQLLHAGGTLPVKARSFRDFASQHLRQRLKHLAGE